MMPAKKKKTKPEEKAAEETEEKEQPEDGVTKTETSEEPQEETEAVDTSPAKVTTFAQLGSDKPLPDVESESSEEPEKSEKEPQDKTGDAKKAKISSDEVKKWISEVPPETLQGESNRPRINRRLVVVILIAAVISGVVVGGIIYFNSKVSKPLTIAETQPPSPTPQEEVMEEKEAMEEKVDLTQYSVQVLNGSGVPGEAGNAESSLTDAGFENIDTGNADSYDYEQTEVSLKADLPEAIYKAIEDALGGQYNVVKSETTLSEGSDYNIQVIVGAKK